MGVCQMTLEGFNGNSSAGLIGQQSGSDTVNLAAKLLPFGYRFYCHLWISTSALPGKIIAAKSALPASRGSLLFRGGQTLREFRSLVVAVQRIASGRQPLPRRRSAIAEGSADSLTLNRPPFRGVPQQFRIGQHHSPDSHEINPSFAHRRLRHVGEKVL